jgi:hypothetical protein
VVKARPGPWGEVEYVRIVIEPPDEFMASDYNAAPDTWNFPGFDDARLEQLWQQAALDPDQLRALRHPRIREASATGIVLRPGQTLVAGLGTESRAIIYNTLAHLPGNSLQNDPFRFRAEMVDEWFVESGLSQEVIARIRQLLYRRGNALLFSDPGLVFPLIHTAGGRVRLVKTLGRKSTLLLKVRIRPDSDIEGIAAYWSTGRRRKEVRPLLNSLSHFPGGMTIDVAHLLPRLARSLLYTYPSPEVPYERSPDCHWTAMNFFNDQPDDRFSDIEYLKTRLLSDYVQVNGNPTMGDLLLLCKPGDEVIHSCVYVADDIVFTKNGQSAMVPWTLTTLQDLQANYLDDPSLQLRIYRMK